MNWKTIRRETELIEHICEHGVGHPNAGSIQFVDWAAPRHEERYTKSLEELLETVPNEPKRDSAWAIHGCDGCCSRRDFPGTAAGAVVHSLMTMSKDRWESLKENDFQLYWGLLALILEYDLEVSGEI